MNLHVPSRGAWFSDIDCEDDTGTLNPGDLCSVTMPGAALQCRAMPSFTGTRALQRKLRVQAGNGGWGSLIASAAYHNDAGIKAASVVRELAAVVGETLGSVGVERAILGVDYLRRAGVASRALEEIIGAVPWYVDYAGVTQIGARVSAQAPADSYEVLEYNPRTHVALIALDTLSVGVGSAISTRLDTVETIQSFDLELNGKTLRMHAYCGPSLDSTTQLESLIRRIVERITDQRFLGPYRYRVVSMAVDGRVNLQAVNKRAGAPDALLVEQWPGVAGAHAELTPGATVIVEFADGGDPTQPIITHYRGRQDAKYIPARLTIGANNPTDAVDVAYKGGTVNVLLPPMIFEGTITIDGTPSPATGVLQASTATTLGTIADGSTKAGVGL